MVPHQNHPRSHAGVVKKSMQRCLLTLDGAKRLLAPPHQHAVCRAWRWRPATAGSAFRTFGDGPLAQICLEMSGLMGLRLGLL